MNVLRFNDGEEMLRYLRSDHHGLHHEQHLLAGGDHWASFYDLDRRIVIFGEILTAVGPNVYSQTYDHLHPEGGSEWWHKAHVWPINSDLFNEARSVGWVIDSLPTWAQFNLTVAFRAHRAHLQGMAR